MLLKFSRIDNSAQVKFCKLDYVVVAAVLSSHPDLLSVDDLDRNFPFANRFIEAEGNLREPFDKVKPYLSLQMRQQEMVKWLTNPALGETNWSEAHFWIHSGDCEVPSSIHLQLILHGLSPTPNRTSKWALKQACPPLACSEILVGSELYEKQDRIDRETWHDYDGKDGNEFDNKEDFDTVCLL